ncbi:MULTISPECIES: RES family NAD+ phosphorylase [Sphingomonadales]|uniref:RES domain-containing protein n=2 Tax=Sphingomonadaceae TaxID=41297 RepID=A0A397P8N6_9SPHN|nr:MULTISPECIES: RES family NAD+ phosphorylase [Sphingomonadaceae]MDF0545497.1 RES family NAD+ phosphorylase [Sphingobium arseniciresistens]RIA45936.1 RES domain-containing protein [Hephaestia caeni]WQE08218.1 RES family NAD+ phosphorylase [Sphingobium yanoikuyae]
MILIACWQPLKTRSTASCMVRKKGTITPTPSPAPLAPAPVIPTAASTGVIIPTPPTDLAKLICTTTWPKTRLIHRIHQDRFRGEEFNPGPDGNARFSPICDAKGNSIPTIYGGETFDCAGMESVFHDVPFAPGLKSLAKRKLRGHHYSQVLATTDLLLVDLSSTALRNLGIKRGELIETEKDVYPQTRKWAEAIHAQCPDVQGLCWVSRQDDRSLAIMLFGDRTGTAPLSAHASAVDIVNDAATYADIIKLAERIGVNITGK